MLLPMWYKAFFHFSCFFVVMFAWVDADVLRPSKVIQIGLLSDGRAIITEELDLHGIKQIQLDLEPSMVPGTLWFKEVQPEQIRLTEKHVQSNLPPKLDEGEFSKLQERYAGQLVTLYFRDGSPPLKGRFVKRASLLDEAKRTYMALQEGESIRYIDPTLVAMVQGGGATIQKPYLSLGWRANVQFSETTELPPRIHFSYVIEGIQSEFHYLIDRTAAMQTRIDKSIRIHNRWKDFSDVEIEYVSAEPNFNGVSQTPGYTAADPDWVWLKTISMKQGEVLELRLESAEISVNDWVFVEILGSFKNPSNVRIQLDDALTLQNPFEGGMVPGDAIVAARGRFLGSGKLQPSNDGDWLLAYRKAGGVSLTPSEQRVSATGPGMSAYSGELMFENARFSAINFRVIRQLKAEHIQPEAALSVRPALNPNEGSRIRWDFLLEPGSSQRLTYEFQLQTDGAGN